MSVAFRYKDDKLFMRVTKDGRVYETEITDQLSDLTGTLTEKLDILMDLDFNISEKFILDYYSISATANWNDVIKICIDIDSFKTGINQLKVEKQLEAKNKCIEHIKQMIRDCINKNPYGPIIVKYDDIFLEEMHQVIKDYFNLEGMTIKDYAPCSHYIMGIKFNL